MRDLFDQPDEDLMVTEPTQQLTTQEIPAMPQRRAGWVRWFSGEKGYGFIVPGDGGEDVFVRHSAIESNGFRTLHENEHVSYELGDDGRGPRALRVRGE